MIKARVLYPILHLGKTYDVGDEIYVDSPTAHQLVAARVIAVATAPAPDAQAVVKGTPQVRKP
jgi:hypothetical protein